MLNIYWGMDWQQNRAEILRQICSHAAAGQEAIWIVPEQASFEAEQLLCVQGGNTISRYAQVLSFTRLANRVFSLCGGIARQTMDKGGQVLAMAQAVEQVRSRLKLYAAGSRRPAFLPELLAAVDEFKSYGVTPDLLQQAAKQEGGQLAVKLEELALILESYDAVCAGAKQDPRDRLAYLSRVLQDCDFAADKAFYIDGFSDFTGVELQIIGQLLRSGADVTVCLCCDDLLRGLPVFEASRKTAMSLMQAADRAHQKTYTHPIVAAEPDEIRYAAQHLFGAGEKTWADETRQIHLRRCEDTFDEARAVAATIIQLLHQGYRYADIAIASAEYPACRTIYDTVLRGYEIPLYFAGVESVLRKPVFEMLMTALEAASGAMERDTVLWWLKSGFSGLDWEQVDRLENYAITWNVSGSRWESEWTSHPQGYDAKWKDADLEQLRQLNESRTIALAPLLRLRQRLQRALTVGQMVRDVYAFLEDLSLDTQLEKQAKQQYEAGHLQQAQQTAQLYEILLSALEQMYALLESAPITAADFTQMLQVLLSQYDAGTIPSSLDCVICGSIADLRYHSQKVLLVTGCQEGLLPAYRTQSGLLSEQERDQLLRYGIELAPDAWGALSRDLAALHNVMQGALEHLYWFASAEEPSYLHVRMEQLFPVRNKEYETAQYPAELFSAAALAAAAVNQEETAFAPQAVRLLRDPQVDARIRALRQQAAYQTGTLQSKTVTGMYGEKIFLSASQVQTFAECRQAHFLKYGLKAKKRMPAEFDAPIFGTFVHEVLEKTVKQVQDEGGFAQVPTERVQQIAQTHIDSFTQEHCGQPEQQNPRFMYLYERNFEEIMQVIGELEEELRHCTFIPERFELPFRTDAPMGPVEIQGEKGTAQVSGAVDRVDMLHAPHGDFVRVVDYKTGSKDFDYTDLLCGMGLQMLIYLFALEENGHREFGYPVKPAGVLYFPARKNVLTADLLADDETIDSERQADLKRKGLLLNDDYLLQAMEPCQDSPRYLPYKIKKGEKVGDLADSEQLQLLRRHVKRMLAQFTDEIFAGDITPNPYERGANSACGYCDFAEICHKTPEQVRRLQKVSASDFWKELERKEDAAHG